MAFLNGKLVDVSENRVALFAHIAIEIASRCNRHCYFCPNGYHNREDVFMPWSTIKKIVAELKELKYQGRVELYIYNEPTRDPRLKEIIKYIRRELPKVCMMINTNGDYFKGSGDIWQLFEAGLNQMQINIYSAADNNKDPGIFEKGVRLAQKRSHKLRQWVYELNDASLVSVTLPMYSNIGPRARVARVIDKFGIKPDTGDNELDENNHFSNRSGNVPGFRSKVSEPLRKMCARPFRFLNINYTGQAILCCNDYKGETDFGNVNQQTLVEIWNSEAFNVYRLKLQNKKRDCFLCHNCDFKGGFYQHNVNHVTFGAELDKAIVEADLTERKTIFK